MNRVSIGAALGEGFSLMRRRPLSVLTWGAVQAAVSGLGMGLYFSVYLSLFARIFAAGRGAGAGAGAAPDPAVMAQMMQLQGFNLLLTLLNVVVGVVVYSAAFRAVLFPEARRFAYMRLGMSELLLGVAGIAAYFALSIGLLLILLPVFIVGAAFAAAHQPALGAILAALFAVAAIIVLAWVGLRFVLLGPLAVRDRTLDPAAAWAISRGHVAPLFGIAICQVVLLLVFELVLIFVVLLLVAGALGITVGLDGLRAFFQHPTMPTPGQIIPWVMVGVLMFIPVGGGLIAFMAAPWARVLQDLTHSEALEAFS